MGDPSNSSRTIAIFDYDNTLVKGDSLWPFLVAVAGWGRALAALAVALAALPWECLRGGDYRTCVKEKLLSRLLAGKRIEDLLPAIQRLRHWPHELETMQALRDHHAKGHHVVIASGSLDVYLPALLENVPHHALLCTEMENVNGVLTGRMASGNCVRQRKAERVAAYIAKNGPFMDSWGYGNAPHDLPMLGQVAHRVVI